MSKRHKPSISEDDEYRFLDEIKKEEEARTSSIEAARLLRIETTRKEKRAELERTIREKYLYGERSVLEASLADQRNAAEKSTQQRLVQAVPEIHKQGGAIRIRTGEQNTVVSKHGYSVVYKRISVGPYWKMFEGTRKDENGQIMHIAVTILDTKAMPPKKRENYEKQGYKIMRYLASNPHPHIIHFYDLFQFDSEIHSYHGLVNHQLESLVKRGHVLKEERARSWGYELATAIHFLHSSGIAHRAISPQTVWFDKELSLKLGNFGFSCVYWDNHKKTRIFVPPIHEKEMPFHPPEEVGTSLLDPPKQDIYCWAATVVFMLTKEYPPKARGSFSAFAEAKLSAVSLDGRIILDKCLHFEPSKRPAAHQLVHDVWFKNFLIKVIPVTEPVMVAEPVVVLEPVVTAEPLI